MGDPGALALDTSTQIVGDLLIMEENVHRQLEGLSKNKSAGPDDVHWAIIKPLAGITAGAMCRLFRLVYTKAKYQTIGRM